MINEISGVIISLLFILIGLQAGFRAFNRDSEISRFELNKSSTTFLLKCSQVITDTSRAWQHQIMEVRAYLGDSSFIEIKGEASVIIESDSLLLRPGDLIIAEATPSQLPSPIHPEAFDYSEYLQRRGVDFQIFVSKNKYELLCRSCKRNLKDIALAYRSKIERLLENTPLEVKSKSFLNALLLGDRELLKEDRIQRFRNAGVMHVMAVSGLHVGTLYYVLNMLAGFLSKIRLLKYLRLPLILSLLWGYCFITGLSPSVLRASLVISLIIIGKAINEKVRTHNLLAVSAIILLLYQPYFLFDLGFQLSYAAVLSILLIQPIIYRLFAFKYLIADKVWSLASVTLAAQLGTLPLTLSSFHQFPTYFLLGNLLVIPFVTILFYLGLFTLLFILVSSISTVLALIINHLIRLLDLFLEFISQLPHAVIYDVFVPMTVVYLSYLLLGFIVLRIKNGNRLFSYMSLIVAIFCSQIIIKHHQSTLNPVELIVYNYRNEIIPDIIHGETHTMVLSKKLIETSESFLSLLQNIHLKRGIKKVKLISIDSTFYGENDQYYLKVDGGWCFVKMGDKKVLLNNQMITHNWSREIHCNYFIGRDNLSLENKRFIRADSIVILQQKKSTHSIQSEEDDPSTTMRQSKAFTLKLNHSTI